MSNKAFEWSFNRQATPGPGAARGQEETPPAMPAIDETKDASEARAHRGPERLTSSAR